MKLKGRVALITGGARGIGRAIALGMAREGADVVIADLDVDTARVTKQDADALGVRAAALRLDVSDSASVQRVHREVLEELGKIDILVNNAGIGTSTRDLDVSEQEWDRVLAVNLKGMFLCCKEAIPSMAERGWGRVVNISSASAFHGNFLGDISYAASKAGVLGLTKALARLYAVKGVTVNAIAPAPIAMADRPPRKESDEWVARFVPMGRRGFPEEVAAVAVFLASNEAGFITGATMDVNGGAIMR